MDKLKSLKRAKRIPDPVFKSNVYLFQSKDDLISAYKEMNFDPDELTWLGGCQLTLEHTKDRTTTRLIIIGVFNQSITTLAHEVNHAAFQILSHVGIKIENPKDGANETFCYLSEYLLEECLKHFKSE